MREAPQIRLSWNIDKPMNPRIFRAALSRNLAATAPAHYERSWLFNHDGEANSATLATVRFYAGFNQHGPTVGIVGVGEDACAQLSSGLIHILPAITPIVGKAAPQVKLSKAQWGESEPQEYRITKLVLRTKKLRQTRDALEKYHQDPSLLAEFIAPVVANGIMAQAEAIGLDVPDLAPNDVFVVRVDGFGAQPLDHKNSRVMLPRVPQVIVSMPVKLDGEWSVGPLLTYGNGRISRSKIERHYKTVVDGNGIPAAAREDMLALREAA